MGDLEPPRETFESLAPEAALLPEPGRDSPVGSRVGSFAVSRCLNLGNQFVCEVQIASFKYPNAGSWVYAVGVWAVVNSFLPERWRMDGL